MQPLFGLAFRTDGMLSLLLFSQLATQRPKNNKLNCVACITLLWKIDVFLSAKLDGWNMFFIFRWYLFTFHSYRLLAAPRYTFFTTFYIAEGKIGQQSVTIFIYRISPWMLSFVANSVQEHEKNLPVPLFVVIKPPVEKCREILIKNIKTFF